MTEIRYKDKYKWLWEMDSVVVEMGSPWGPICKLEALGRLAIWGPKDQSAVVSSWKLGVWELGSDGSWTRSTRARSAGGSEQGELTSQLKQPIHSPSTYSVWGLKGLTNVYPHWWGQSSLPACWFKCECFPETPLQTHPEVTLLTSFKLAQKMNHHS